VYEPLQTSFYTSNRSFNDTRIYIPPKATIIVHTFCFNKHRHGTGNDPQRRLRPGHLFVAAEDGTAVPPRAAGTLAAAVRLVVVVVETAAAAPVAAAVPVPAGTVPWRLARQSVAEFLRDGAAGAARGGFADVVAVVAVAVLGGCTGATATVALDSLDHVVVVVAAGGGPVQQQQRLGAVLGIPCCHCLGNVESSPGVARTLVANAEERRQWVAATNLDAAAATNRGAALVPQLPLPHSLDSPT